MLRIEAREEEHTPRTGLRLTIAIFRGYDSSARMAGARCLAPRLGWLRMRAGCGGRTGYEVRSALRAPSLGAG